MNKSYRTTVFLLALMGGLAAWFFLYEEDFRADKEKAVEEEKRFFATLDKKAVQYLSLDRLRPANDEEAVTAKSKTRQAFQFKRTDPQRWDITSPISDLGDLGTLKTLVNSIVDAKSEREIESAPTDLKKYGLDPAEIRVTLQKDSKSPKQTLLIGKETPVGQGVYAQVEGQKPVYRVARSLRQALNKPFKEFRDRSVLKNEKREDMNKIEVHNAQGRFFIRRSTKDPAQWFVGRSDIPADSAESTKLINTVTDLRIDSFVAESSKNLAKYGLHKPKTRFWVTTKDKRRIGVALTEHQTTYYAKRLDKPNVYTIHSDEPYKVLKRAEKSFKSFQLAKFNRFNIKKIRLEQKDYVVDLEKKERGWQFVGDTTSKIDDAKVDTLLAAIQDAKITKYTPGKKTALGLKDPHFKVALFEDEKGKLTEVVHLDFGNTRFNQVYASRKGLNVSFQLPLADVKKLKKKKREFILVEKKADNSASSAKKESQKPSE